jgi:hypothetical protein
METTICVPLGAGTVSRGRGEGNFERAIWWSGVYHLLMIPKSKVGVLRCIVLEHLDALRVWNGIIPEVTGKRLQVNVL